MDATDETIVALLRENARRSFQDIGNHVHLSAPAVKRRVDRLEREGVLLGYTAIVDPEAFGWHDMDLRGRLATDPRPDLAPFDGASARTASTARPR